MFDLDPQASSANWSDRRSAELPVVLSALARCLPHEIRRVREIGVEMLYLNTAPHSDSAALEAARAADLVLIPCRPAILDLEAITDTLAFICTTGTPAAVVLNAVAPTVQDAALAEQALAAQQVQTCPVRMGRRIAFARALINGQTAKEFEPDGNATREIEHVHTFVCDLVHMCTHAQNGVPSDVQQIR